MPELPEVETVATLIRPSVTDRTVAGVRVSWERSLGGTSRAAFGRRLRGTRIARVWRRAKYIVMDLERDGVAAGAISVHLRMSGRLFVEPASEPRSPYERVALRLDDGNELRFEDVRKFGRFVHVADVDDALDHLGPEPLDDAFTADWLRTALRGRRRALKPLLLDQSFLAGLGNIYVDEALHISGLHPLRRSDRVPKARVARLHAAIQSVLREAIKREGSSFDTFYRTPEGNPGSYQHQFQVYGRDGLDCRTCGRTIRKLVVGQRGTHVCTRCQPAPRPRRDGVVIRRARVADGMAIGALHVETWQAAYAHVMPASFLASLDLIAWGERRTKFLQEPPDIRRQFVAHVGRELQGFAIAGPSRDADDKNGVAEIYAIYVRPTLFRRGVGSRLMAHTIRDFRKRGFGDITLWVLEDNPRARGFYERVGFRPDGARKMIEIGGTSLPEVRYRNSGSA